MTKQEVVDIATKLCGVLTDMGCEYHFETDNRSKSKSCYIYVRRPKYMEIRISDHPPGRRRYTQFDIGPHGLSVETALEKITTFMT